MIAESGWYSSLLMLMGHSESARNWQVKEQNDVIVDVDVDK